MLYHRYRSVFGDLNVFPLTQVSTILGNYWITSHFAVWLTSWPMDSCSGTRWRTPLTKWSWVHQKIGAYTPSTVEKNATLMNWRSASQGRKRPLMNMWDFLRWETRIVFSKFRSFLSGVTAHAVHKDRILEYTLPFRSLLSVRLLMFSVSLMLTCIYLIKKYRKSSDVFCYRCLLLKVLIS